MFKHSHTARGFEHVEFKDFYEAKCYLQQSSIAIYEQPGSSCVWLGLVDADPKIMWKDALRLGMDVPKREGWYPFKVPEEVMLSTKMHLSREQVQELIVNLQRWLKTGSFKA